MEAALSYISYAGPSMNPILKSGDLLEVVPYNGKTIQRGDVILFFCEDENRKVVHRVVAMNAHGVRTMGDNNGCVDPWVVSARHILGHVIRAQRGRRWRRIAGGRAGQWTARVARLMRRAQMPLPSGIDLFRLRVRNA
jgi:hypothetical protein